MTYIARRDVDCDHQGSTIVPRLSREENYLRRALDLSFIVVVAPFALPFGLIIAALLKASEPDDGVFHGVDRFGLSGKRFTMWKFRSMRNDHHLVQCEKVIREFAPELDFKLKNDPRTSPIGAVLRRTHMDELPQLVNVLTGDMTLVGPRPNSLPPTEYKHWQLERLSVRPGLTGPWQLHGKRKTNYDERFRKEIDYIRQRTVWSEIKIIFETAWHCLNQKGMS